MGDGKEKARLRINLTPRAYRYLAKLLKTDKYFPFISVLVLATTLAGCGCLGAGAPRKGRSQVGMASWYGEEFHGRPTSSGEIFDMYKLTAAHKELPLGTRVLVTNLKNRKRVVVKINDRGPFVPGRIIDLSYAAAKKIEMIGDGIVKVRVEVAD